MWDKMLTNGVLNSMIRRQCAKKVDSASPDTPIPIGRGCELLCANLDGDLPVFPGASVEEAIHGGEDYELLFTVRPDVKLPATIKAIPITRIGRIISDRKNRIRIAGDFQLEPLGYDHFRQRLP